jgi:hypothetical protein
MVHQTFFTIQYTGPDQQAETLRPAVADSAPARNLFACPSWPDS